MVALLFYCEVTSEPIWKQDVKGNCHGLLPSSFLPPAFSPVLPLTCKFPPNPPNPCLSKSHVVSEIQASSMTTPKVPFPWTPTTYLLWAAQFLLDEAYCLWKVLTCVSYKTPCQLFKDKGHFFCGSSISHSAGGLKDPLFGLTDWKVQFGSLVLARNAECTITSFHYEMTKSKIEGPRKYSYRITYCLECLMVARSQNPQISRIW